MTLHSDNHSSRFVTSQHPAVLGERLELQDPDEAVSDGLFEVTGVPVLSADELAAIGDSGYSEIILDLSNGDSHLQAYPHELRRVG